MVRGLELFRDHFSDFKDQYVLIGGAACDLAMDEAALPFRATKDLDIVLCVEALSGDFVGAFWEFAKNGHYKNQQKSTGKKLFYRFNDPENENFPWMLEFFSRKPDSLTLEGEPNLTPIPVDEDLSSLSAILMDDGYYGFIHEHKREISGLMAATPECLIPLKARAWLDLTERRESGERVDSRNVQKHKNDVFRLFQLLVPEPLIALPESIRADMQRFFKAVEDDPPKTLKPFGLGSLRIADMLRDLRKIYGLGE